MRRQAGPDAFICLFRQGRCDAKGTCQQSQGHNGEQDFEAIFHWRASVVPSEGENAGLHAVGRVLCG